MTRIVAFISWTIVFLALIITGAPSPQVRFSFSDSSSLDSKNTCRIVACSDNANTYLGCYNLLDEVIITENPSPSTPWWDISGWFSSQAVIQKQLPSLENLSDAHFNSSDFLQPNQTFLNLSQ